MSLPNPHLTPAGILLVLAGASTDAIMILAFNVLTAAQTGNTILFAVAIARGDAAAGISSAISILSFLGGALAGGWSCRKIGHMATLLVELAILAIALAVSLALGTDPAPANLLVALAAASMGIQSSLTISVHGQSGTYITGLLANLAFSLGSRATTPDRVAPGLVWVIYLAGAIVAGLLFVAVGRVALLLPILALAAAVVWIPRLPAPPASSPPPRGGS